MKKIFSFLIAMMTIFIILPVISIEAEGINLDPTKTKYCIEFKPGDGKGTAQTSSYYPLETGVTLPTAAALSFTYEGYYCTGWKISSSTYTEGSAYTFKTSHGSVDGSGQYKVTATAVWANENVPDNPEIKMICASFEPGKGEGKIYYQYYDAGESFTLPSCPFTYSGYKFVGWSNNIDGKTYPAGTKIASYKDVIFVAEWEKINTGITENVPEGIVNSGYCGAEGDGTNLEWKIDVEGTLTISGTGRMADYADNFMGESFDKPAVPFGWGGGENPQSTAPWKSYKDKVTKLVIGEGVTYIGRYAFWGMNITGELHLPSTMKELALFSLCGNNFTGDLIIPEGMEKIDGSALQNSGDYGMTYIPASLIDFEYHPFRYCAVEEIVVHEDNPSYCAVDGVLFSKDKTVIYQYPQTRTGTYTLLDSVRTIKEGAFENIDLSEIIINGDIDEIGSGAFSFNRNDMKVIFNGKVGTIKNSFNATLANTEVYFVGGAPEKVYEKNESGTQSFDAKNGKTITIYYLSGTEDLWEFDENGLWKGFEVKPYTAVPEVEFDSNDYLYSGYCGKDPLVDGKNLAWGIDKNGVLTIFGKGEMADYEYGNLGDGTWGVNSPWYSYRNEITAIKIEEGITRISEYAFGSLTEVESEIIIPESVTSIGTYAFWYAAKESITIPASVTEIEGSPFAYCVYLKEINVAEYNPVFCSKDGKLYSKDMKTLYAWPNLRNEKIAYVSDGVETIATGAFDSLVGMDVEVDIVLPDTVKTIKEYAFCVNGRIVVNSKIDLVENFAFSPWNGTLSIYFMNGVPKNIAGTSFRDNGTIKLYYLEGTEGFTVDENGLWNGYEVTPFKLKVDATVTIDSVSIVNGTNKTVSVSISENSNAEMIQFAIEYDPSVLKVVFCSAGSIVSDALINSNEPGIIYFIWEALSPINSAGELLNIEFAVADGAKAQETTVEISNEEELLFVDPSYEELNVEIVNGTVKVIDVLYGDVNGDGKINVIDANLVRKAAAKMITLDENQKLAADVNGDGKVNVIDANLIRKYAAKVISAFPIAE